MTSRKLAAAVLSLAVMGFAADGNAQSGGRLFFEGDMVRGDQEGAPGPFCVLTNQFKRLEKVVWRVRVLDQTGKPLDDKGLKSLAITLPDGQTLPGRYSPHPGPRSGPPQDYFWSARWIIPTGYPSGTFVYKVVATDLDGKTHTWEPFTRVTSQLQVIPGEIEIRKEAAAK
jgi:hypothetical protein